MSVLAKNCIVPSFWTLKKKKGKNLKVSSFFFFESGLCCDSMGNMIGRYLHKKLADLGSETVKKTAAWI